MSTGTGLKSPTELPCPVTSQLVGKCLNQNSEGAFKRSFNLLVAKILTTFSQRKSTLRISQHVNMVLMQKKAGWEHFYFLRKSFTLSAIFTWKLMFNSRVQLIVSE